MRTLHKLVTVCAATAVLGVVAVVNTTPPSVAVSLAGYGGYTPESFAADGVAEQAARTSLVTSASSAAVAGDFAEANGGDGGSGSHYCSVEAYKPRGYFDGVHYTVHVQVTADVWCNFTSPEIRVKVVLQGHEGGRSVAQPSPDVTCAGAATCSATANYSRYMYCDESFHFEHYSRPYGSYRLKNGAWRTLVGDGVQGPSTAGGAYRVC